MNQQQTQSPKKQPRFETDLEIMPLSDGETWMVREDLVYYSAVLQQQVTVPSGFATDLASIPKLERIGGVLLLIAWIWRTVLDRNISTALAMIGFLLVFVAGSLKHYGRYTKAAVVHDWLYSTQLVPRDLADAVLWEAMQVTKTEWWKRWLIYKNVRRWGWGAWLLDRKKAKR